MPRRGKGGRTIRCNVGELLDGCSELHELISSGVFESKSGNASARAARLSALRCVDKRFNVHIDEMILKWMKETMALVEVQRKQELVLSRIDALNVAFRIPLVECKTEDLMELSIARSNTTAHISHFFSPSTVDTLSTAIRTLGEDAIMSLQPTILTFMCIALSRCQVHGPLGQPCRRHKRGRHAFGDNYGTTGGTNRVCLHANQRCVDSMCVLQRGVGGKESESTHTWMTFRSMLRMKDIHFPFDLHDVLLRLKESPLYEDAYGETLVPREASGIKPWAGIPVFSHPMWGSDPSIQDLLGLNDAQVKACSDDAHRKDMQAQTRANEIQDITIRQLSEDLDEMVKNDVKLPFTSLRNMADSLTGAERTINAAIRANINSNVKHGQDIRFARDAITTVGFFLTDVYGYERTTFDSISSSEAYDFVSGLHIGLYGTCCPFWKRYYGTLKTTTAFSPEKLSLALRLFDSITKGSLVRRGKNMLLVTNSTSVTVTLPAIESVLVGHFSSLVASLKFLVKHHHNKDPAAGCSAIEIPPLPISRSRPTLGDYEQWAYDTFKLMADYPWLRCGALDVLGIDSRKLVECTTLA